MVDGEVGYITLTIWDAILSTKSYKRSSYSRFFGWTSGSKNSQTLWKSLRRDCWSLHNPDIFRRTSLAIILWWRINNGSYKNIIAVLGVVLVSPQNYVIRRAFSLAKLCSNNIVEYNALLIRMQLAEEIGIKHLEVYGDSKLIVYQDRGEYEVWHEDLVPYHNTTINMVEKFKSFYINHVSRQQNTHTDVLASLAASLALPARAIEKILVHSRDLYFLKFALEDNQTPEWSLHVKKVLETSTGSELRDWRFSFIDYILYGILPNNSKETAAIRRKAPSFY